MSDKEQIEFLKEKIKRLEAEKSVLEYQLEKATHPIIQYPFKPWWDDPWFVEPSYTHVVTTGGTP